MLNEQMDIGMHRMRRVAKWTGIVLGGLTGLGIAIYATLLFINRADEPPSDVYLAYAALMDDQADLVAAENAVVYVAGINAAPEQDPRELGARWLAWAVLPFEQRSAQEEPRGMPMRQLFDAIDASLFHRLSTTCRRPSDSCMTALSEEHEMLHAEQDGLEFILSRYRELLQHARWQEPPPAYDLPFADYSNAFAIGATYQISSWLAGRSGETQAGLEMLEQEALFWRMVLAESDSLISKIIAEARLQQNLAWTNRVLKDFPADAYHIDVWQQPLTQSERSLQRTFAGELYMQESYFRSGLFDAEGILAAMWLGLSKPFLKQQATMNLIADRYSRVELALAVDYAELGSTVSQLREDERDRLLASQFSPYNPIGRTLYSIVPPDLMTDPGLRVVNLEGSRRVFLLATELRAQGVSHAELPERIKASGLRNPYTDEPFGWDEETGAITFELQGHSKDDSFALPY